MSGVPQQSVHEEPMLLEAARVKRQSQTVFWTIAAVLGGLVALFTVATLLVWWALSLGHI